jgi:hypothetical protein
MNRLQAARHDLARSVESHNSSDETFFLRKAVRCLCITLDAHLQEHEAAQGEQVSTESPEEMAEPAKGEWTAEGDPLDHQGSWDISDPQGRCHVVSTSEWAAMELVKTINEVPRLRQRAEKAEGDRDRLVQQVQRQAKKIERLTQRALQAEKAEKALAIARGDLERAGKDHQALLKAWDATSAAVHRRGWSQAIEDASRLVYPGDPRAAIDAVKKEAQGA